MLKIVSFFFYSIFFAQATLWNSSSENNFVTYMCDFCCHSLIANFSLVMSYPRYQCMADGLTLSQNAVQYDVRNVVNFWHENKNSTNWCVKHKYGIPRNMTYLILLTLYFMVKLINSLDKCTFRQFRNKNSKLTLHSKKNRNHL